MPSIGWKNPVQHHECVIERRDTKGLLPRHPLYAGEYRAVCTGCMWDGGWKDHTRRSAEEQAEVHATWAGISTGGDARQTTPRRP